MSNRLSGSTKLRGSARTAASARMTDRKIWIVVAFDLHEDRLAELCKRYGVAELSVFGSVARGDDESGSDVDLLYVLASTTRLGWKIVDLKFDLEEILSRPVDLVPKSGLKWLIRDWALTEARVL